jgi:hypothetical protein
MFEDDEYQEFPEYPDYPQPYPRQQSQQFYAGTLGNVLQALTEYTRTLEQEKTKRADTERKRTNVLSVIRSQRQIMIEYLNHRFGERYKLYERYFQLIDTALELQNDEITRLALESILNIYQNNPCLGLEEFRQQFESMSEVVRI